MLTLLSRRLVRTLRRRKDVRHCLCRCFADKPRVSRSLSSGTGRALLVVPTAVVIAGLLGYQQYSRVRERNLTKLGHPIFWPPWRVRVYASMPYRLTSRLFGLVADTPLPRPLRRPLIGAYAWLFDARLDEALNPQLDSYRSLADFFMRPLRADARPLSDTPLVSPADGRVLVCGEVENGRIEQVKGITYELEEFFGPDTLPKVTRASSRLMYCVVYLAPGDYHGFHSPADWNIGIRRHFSGLMMSVRQKILTRVPGVFCLNERVLLCGDWCHGVFSFTAVGATNVGNIKVENDELVTNVGAHRVGATQDRRYDDAIGDDVVTVGRPVKKGAKLGEFRMGSSIVLVFEAPLGDFRFTVRPGDAVRYGQALAIVEPPAEPDTTDR